ncbi:MAG: SDR family oxidoreductase [Bdellovibrionales bacterium]|nr:SDR family oxidoreductase [Bdellovibrionales bacterium]
MLSTGEPIVIFGATSLIAEHVARLFAERRHSIILVARDNEKLQVLSQDLLSRGASSVVTHVVDLADVNNLEQAFGDIVQHEKQVGCILVAHGVLPDQEAVQDDLAAILASWSVNFQSPMMLSVMATRYFEARGKGTLAVITSVAGVRARKSNYVYGAAKGALSLFLQGLRNRYGKTDIDVIDIRPGFVDTPMTAHLKKGPLFASAEDVAKGIVQAIDRRQEIIYLPWFWRPIMFIISSIPEKLFKRMSL